MFGEVVCTHICELNDRQTSQIPCLFLLRCNVNVTVFVMLSVALKIQVSGATAELLHTLRGYLLTCRGTLNVKVTLHSCIHHVAD